MDGFTSEDRALFKSDALPLYEEIVQTNGIDEDDERIAPGTTGRAAFDLLVRVGLVQRQGETSTEWTPVDPTSVQAHVVAPLSFEGARLLHESSEWARDFAALTQSWRRSPEAERRGPFSYLHGGAQITSFIAGLLSTCEEEMLTAQPQERRETGEGLARAVHTDGALLKRGARMRTLYQHAARRSTATRAYVAAVTELGAEVRTLDEFFNRMMIFDRRVALIPSAHDLGTALAIREPSVVAYLADVFERSWERARPFTSTDTSLMKDIAAEQRAMTMRMLIEGHSDPAAAKRLGVSPRTYAGYIADLKKEFDAETRFQLGYVIGRRDHSDAAAAAETGEIAD